MPEFLFYFPYSITQGCFAYSQVAVLNGKTGMFPQRSAAKARVRPADWAEP